MSRLESLAWTALVALAWGLVAWVLWLVITAFPVDPPVLPQGIRALDQPRCFPPGTLGVEGFRMCPDSLPNERSA